MPRFGVVADPERRDVGFEIFGLRSLFRPLEGDSTEKGPCWSLLVKFAVVIEDTEPVDDLRRPLIEGVA